MKGSQANNQISGRIYGVLTNSVSGAGAIILFFLFLPIEIVRIDRVLTYLINNNLITTPILFIFVVLSYIIGQMIQSYTMFIPLRSAISKTLYFFPYIPQFEREEVNEGVAERFSWACGRLFYEFDGIESSWPSLDLNHDDLDLAQSYLKNKGVPEVQIYEDISSSFYQLEVLFITSLLFTSIILHPTDIASDGAQISDFFIPIILFVTSVSFLLIHMFLKMVHQYKQNSSVHPNADQRERTKRITRELFFSRLSGLLFLMAIGSFFLLISPLDMSYNSNIEMFLGSFFRYTPFIFLLLIYSSEYVKSRYSMMHKLVIIQDLYTVAISEGDIEETE